MEIELYYTEIEHILKRFYADDDKFPKDNTDRNIIIKMKNALEKSKCKN